MTDFDTDDIQFASISEVAYLLKTKQSTTDQNALTE